jgi:hypothetical protein
MPDELIPYRRLPGTGTGAFERVKLYVGPDHLLMVSSTGYTENYKRFYFRDIQQITLLKSVRGKVWNAVWGFLAFLSAIITLQVSGVALVVWSVITGVFLLLLGINLAAGPTCACRIQTAVQTRPLASLNRVRSARKVMAQLRTLIEGAQEPISNEELALRLDQIRRGILPTSAQLASLVNPTAAPEPPII